MKLKNVLIVVKDIEKARSFYHDEGESIRTIPLRDERTIFCANPELYRNLLSQRDQSVSGTGPADEGQPIYGRRIAE